MAIPGTSSGSLKGLECPGATGDSGMVGGTRTKGIWGATADLDWLLVFRRLPASTGRELVGGMDLPRFRGGNRTVSCPSMARSSVNEGWINKLYLDTMVHAHPH